MTTGPRVGSSSVACVTPDGVMTSMALGTVVGPTLQIGLVPSGAQTPNEKAPAGWVKARAWSELNPSCPVSTTLNAHPDPGVPNWASGSAIVMVRFASSTNVEAVPTWFPLASTQTVGAKAGACASTRSLQAPAGAMV